MSAPGDMIEYDPGHVRRWMWLGKGDEQTVYQNTRLNPVKLEPIGWAHPKNARSSKTNKRLKNITWFALRVIDWLIEKIAKDKQESCQWDQPCEISVSWPPFMLTEGINRNQAANSGSFKDGQSAFWIHAPTDAQWRPRKVPMTGERRADTPGRVGLACGRNIQMSCILPRKWRGKVRQFQMTQDIYWST